MHQGNIATWETCRRLLMIMFGTNTGGIDSLYDGVTYLAPHIRAYEEAWKNRSNDEWVHLFVHTLDSNPRRIWRHNYAMVLKTSISYKRT